MQDKKVFIGLSGGINSMAVLCWLIESKIVPSELHLFYAHLKEHSPDTFKFVAAGIRYARLHFPDVHVKVTRNSVLSFFEEQKMIPHPTISPCTQRLKIEPMEKYCVEHGITIDLIGYVRKETRRIKRMEKKRYENLDLDKLFPIREFNDDWCFEIVDRHIGWHPAIYDIKDDTGKRLFTHNNCLPCKNMYVKDMVNIQSHFPDYMAKATITANKLKKYWGRNAEDYYTQFGREDLNIPQCEICQFD